MTHDDINGITAKTFQEMDDGERFWVLYRAILGLKIGCSERVRVCNRKFISYGVGGVVVGILFFTLILLIGPEAVARFLMALG